MRTAAPRLLIAGTFSALAAASVLTAAPPAHADNIGYLVNVTVRPGYNFPNADAALSYGYGVCDQINSGVSYAQLVNTIKSDFNTNDEFQASYLISQSAQELCPAAIWQLRQSAAGYVPSA
ncbi:DUF732 domain-containing protein [Mycobacterium sp. CVI_P3]|uniref:DUF732 domain-containing protein n=1 Tax=Mycobacterium pinniadriaticum TaxID=2994102 RepID=A0ABT3SAF5_9MYCO|nr:DUF732 domain-containing protein [Mycobacterium pinniadriaticum]MCX2929850.1 DUF732 domain-containing protein [Mycobacterium pinniadriaticum]MCX2936501.1 DUF732 domain-containing protein [Mycobacterium pinniadriaticum]